MNLWRLTDYYGRAYYYEIEKSAKRRMKKVLWYYEENKKDYVGSPWFKPPYCEQVMNDQWTSVKLLTDHEIETYFGKQHDKAERHRRIREEYEAKIAADRRALTGAT